MIHAVEITDEQQYRLLYWHKNELQLIQPDSTMPNAVGAAIKKIEKDMQEIVDRLGYVPAP